FRGQRVSGDLVEDELYGRGSVADVVEPGWNLFEGSGDLAQSAREREELLLLPIVPMQGALTVDLEHQGEYRTHPLPQRPGTRQGAEHPLSEKRQPERLRHRTPPAADPAQFTGEGSGQALAEERVEIGEPAVALAKCRSARMIDIPPPPCQPL